jgi:putative protein-disulfide isomerase
MRLLYVFDAYCGWCHGFAPTIRRVAEHNPGRPIEVISGGLFTGSRRVPVGEFGYIAGANARISELTGAQFGAGYQRLIADGAFVMDSEAAARGYAALRHAAPERGLELAGAMQHAFYLDGRSLSEPATYRSIARSAGLDPDTVVADFEGPVARAAAAVDFGRAARLGVTGFPTLLAVRNDSVTVLAYGQGNADQINARLAALDSSVA